MLAGTISLFLLLAIPVGTPDKCREHCYSHCPDECALGVFEDCLRLCVHLPEEQFLKCEDSCLGEGIAKDSYPIQHCMSVCRKFCREMCGRVGKEKKSVPSR